MTVPYAARSELRTKEVKTTGCLLARSVRMHTKIVSREQQVGPRPRLLLAVTTGDKLANEHVTPAVPH